MASLFPFLLLACLAVFATWNQGWIRRWARSKQKIPSSTEKSKLSAESARRLITIDPLMDFEWKDTQPLKHRPFKPIYHITMALQASTPSELITIDNNYQERVRERKDIMSRHAPTVMGAIPAGHDAVREVYSYLLGEYLPLRYPSMFTISADGNTFVNEITSASWPILPPDDPLDAFRILGETVEDDIFLLDKTDDGHRCVAFICCYPSGFDPSDKLGMLLKDIHSPVPAYDKIGPSMERFFSRLEVGESVKRVNWAITTQPERFLPGGSHVYEGDRVEADEDVDIDKARVRIELQTLNRLPKTKAVFFSFKTYQYPVREIKDEGLGPQVADAIEGLKSGNAPGMWVYKGGVRWGRSVCEYLRS